MSVDDKQLEDYKKLCDKYGISHSSDDEYRDSANNLYAFVELSLDMAREEVARQHRLKENPNGFAFKSQSRTCVLCGHSTEYDEDMWYDKWGMKCLDCQEALNKKVIPGYVFKDSKNEKHITASSLSWKFKMSHPTIKKLVHDGQLKARVIKGHKYGDTLVFLRKENPNLKSVVEAELKVAAERKAKRVAQ